MTRFLDSYCQCGSCFRYRLTHNSGQPLTKRERKWWIQRWILVQDKISPDSISQNLLLDINYDCTVMQKFWSLLADIIFGLFLQA